MYPIISYFKSIPISQSQRKPKKETSGYPINQIQSNPLMSARSALHIEKSILCFVLFVIYLILYIIHEFSLRPIPSLLVCNAKQLSPWCSSIIIIIIQDTSYIINLCIVEFGSSHSKTDHPRP
ncbi:hypothetical protein OCU04_006358 [Sclerotinia nivalis]|uniref:Uncharacterized protein n=1 Tax=Sclerotinia nivalis TaxID=352851 RepID=A0A9X0DL78_9HELO|nr:hypothetical protein OCU04_006358 [Sclerotinia nivalis]